MSARWNGLVRAACSTAFALALVVGAAEPSTADDDTGGSIVFASDRTGNLELWVMTGDGTNQVQLTTSAGDDTFPAWSPDGRRIAFGRQLVPGVRSSSELFVMNADGTGVTQLTSIPGSDTQPTWSPDGRRIAWRHVDPGFNFEIYVMNADGTDQRNVTNNPALDAGPDWSRGNRIAFHSDRSGAVAVYTMRPNGKGVRKLTDDSLDAFDPAWSPDGGQIAFADHASFGESDLFVIDADGGAVTQLFETPENETGATWSPDGDRIAFERFELTPDFDFVVGSGEIYAVDADGESPTNLTNTAGVDEEFPDWAREGDDDESEPSDRGGCRG